MKKRRATLANQDELDFAYRRVLYVLLVAAEALVLLREQQGKWSPRWSIAAISGLIMARNLTEFLFRTGHDFPDDIGAIDFGLRWSPPKRAELSKAQKKRIHKTVGHIVSVDPRPFSKREIQKIVRSQLVAGVEFVRNCRNEAKVHDTGNATKYLANLNNSLAKLKIPPA